jgi:hypothetical protein
VDIGFESIGTGIQGRDDDVPLAVFPIVSATNVATMWVLLPTGRPYDHMELLAFEADSGNRVESIEPTYSFELADGSLFGWMIVAPRENHRYECRWTYRDE